jgi:hypothetical protein
MRSRFPTEDTLLSVPSSNPEKISYETDEEPIILSKALLDIFLKEEHPSDLIGLYCFYYYTGKWQKTNQPKVTTTYAATGLHWGVDKVRAAKQVLRNLGLVSDVLIRNKQNKITDHCIHVNFIWSKSHTMDFPYHGNSPCLEKTEANALSANSINALSSNMPNTRATKTNLFGTYITPSMFFKFWQIYPRKVNQGKTSIEWENLCEQKYRPLWEDVEQAVKNQIGTPRWKDKKYIPFANNWLKERRWLDDPLQMSIPDSNNSTTIGFHSTEYEYQQ